MSANVIESRSALAPSGNAPQPSEGTALVPIEGTALVPRASRWRKFAVKVPWLIAATVIVGFVGVAAFRIYAPTPNVWTDDAYLEAQYATIAPRVAGQVFAIKVDDEDRVKAGQLLVQLDDRDYQMRSRKRRRRSPPHKPASGVSTHKSTSSRPRWLFTRPR